MRHPDTVYSGERVSTAEAVTVRVAVDGRPLHPRSSWRLRNHSPTGFEWGYSGSGPAQLALALCFDALDSAGQALDFYQSFKSAEVCKWGNTWSITAGEIRDMFKRHIVEKQRRLDEPLTAHQGEKGASHA